MKDQQIKALAKPICGSIEAQSYCKDCYDFDKCRVAQVPCYQTTTLDTLFDEADVGICSNRTYSDIGLVDIS